MGRSNEAKIWVHHEKWDLDSYESIVKKSSNNHEMGVQDEDNKKMV